jgi:flagellar biosynthetic protein FlhB
MSSEGEGPEKSFEPTQSKIDRARREGDVAYSRDATEAAVYLGAFVAIAALAGGAALRLAEGLKPLLENPDRVREAADFEAALQAVLISGAVASAPFLIAPMLLAAGSVIAQNAFVFAPGKLSPKWQRLSPVDNARKKFGPDGLVEFAKSVLKLAIVGAALAFLAVSAFPDLAAYVGAPPQSVAPAMQEDASLIAGLAAALAIIIGAADLVWTRFSHRKKLMMTLEEMRQESKESDGDPHMKHARRDRARAIATNRMLLDVPKATVVIVNPTHYAVALRWDGPKSGAPVCVAKGVDEMAARIRALAAASGVPIRHDPPAARALFSVVDVGEEVRREHFAAVAAAIHFAERMRRSARGLDATR